MRRSDPIEIRWHDPDEGRTAGGVYTGSEYLLSTWAEARVAEVTLQYSGGGNEFAERVAAGTILRIAQPASDSPFIGLTAPHVDDLRVTWRGREYRCRHLVDPTGRRRFLDLYLA